jgi:hypothetical protein
MKHLFIGWDVGAWHCDDGDSRDALHASKVTRPSSREICARLLSLQHILNVDKICASRHESVLR